MVRHKHQTPVALTAWRNLVNMLFICIKISNNMAQGMLNLQA